MPSDPSDPSAPFGELLRRARRAAGLTQAELAARAGLSWRGITDLERGVRRRPRRDTVTLLAEALGLAGEERAAFAAAARLPSAPPPSTGAARPPSATQWEPSVPALPGGLVTVLFIDLAGTTPRLQRPGGPHDPPLRAAVQRLLRAAVEAHDGREVDTAGEACLGAFVRAPDAVACAAAVLRALAARPGPAEATVRVRMGLHTGTALLSGERYVGLDVQRAARIAAAGHGRQVLLSQPVHDLVADALPDGALLRDLGAHRLTDLQRPEPLWQLVLLDVPGLPADFPPLHTLDRRPHNLPVQPTLLLGREREVRQVKALLRREDVRLVTLSGVGGVGKTRLALQVAAELLDDFADGVYFVPLSRLFDPALVLPTIARTLGLRELGGRPMATTLAGYLRDKQVLLVLDNFEQVVVAASALAGLLQTCAGLKVLATSRVALHLRGEKRYGVRPLPLPDPAHLPPPERLGQVAVVALFVQRAQDASAEFVLTGATAPVVAAICARLDGLPLAIELAAAKVRVLAPTRLLGRLERQLPLLTGGARDAPERQQTMRATLAWSEDLLAPEERRLFHRLAVFVGGFTLEAAEAVCAAPEGVVPLGVGVLEGLAALVDHSLVQPWSVDGTGQDGAQAAEEGSGEERFRLLYVVREYALEQLEASGEAAALRRAHAAYYLGLAEGRASAMFGPEGAAWLGRLEREHDNYRAALAWARERDEVELGLRMASALGFFRMFKGYVTEGRGWVEDLLALAPREAGSGAETGGEQSASGVAGVSTVVQAWALAVASYFAWLQQDDERALAAAAEALALARSQPAEQGASAAGLAFTTLGEIAAVRGELERATTCYEESVARLRAAGEPWCAATCLTNVGAIALDRGDLERARACCEESLAFARRTGADHPEAAALGCLADVARRRGDLAGAESLGREQLLVRRRQGATGYLAGSLEGLALTAAAAGTTREGARAERAARLLGAAASLRERVGTLRGPRRVDVERGAAPARAVLGEERWAAAYAAGRALSLEEAIEQALGEPG